MKGLAFTILIAASVHTVVFSFDALNDSSKLVVKKTTDFTVTGDGGAANWKTTDWINITVQEADVKEVRTTKAKVLYSDLGLYFLFQNEDQKLTATITEDFTALFKEDVIEVFLWPDTSLPLYYEYELSPLNYELIILVPNRNGKTRGWRPWHYEGRNRIQHETSIQGGEKKSGASISGWTAEFFIPFNLLQPIAGTPKSGTQWRANFYRIDYDQGYSTWTWQKTTPNVQGNFHEYEKFGTLIFE